VLGGQGDKPVLQPVDGSKPIPVSVLSADGKNRLPALPKEDSRFPAAATAAKEYASASKGVRLCEQRAFCELHTWPRFFLGSCSSLFCVFE